MKIFLTFIIIFSSTAGFADEFQNGCLARHGQYEEKKTPFDKDAQLSHLTRTCIFEPQAAINSITINLLMNSCKIHGGLLVVQARSNQLNVDCWITVRN